MDVSDALIFAGSAVVGSTDKQDIQFAGGLAASIGINIQFETTRLSILRIVMLSAAGYFAGTLFASQKKK